MRVLYIGQLKDGGTCYDRFTILQILGLDVVPFDVGPFLDAPSKISRSLAARFNVGLAVSALNHTLVAACSEQDYDIAWVDKGTWLWPSTLEFIRERANWKFCLHYTPDAQLMSNKSRHFENCIPIYNLCVTTKHFELDLYRSLGSPNLLTVFQGYGTRFGAAAAASPPRSPLASDVCFVGHCQSHYAKVLKTIPRTGADLKIWGPRWPRYALISPWARAHVRGSGLWGNDYVDALHTTKIGLGLLSKYIPETSTTRSFEIPACATFLLAERSSEHLSLFAEGQEAEFFSDEEELLNKVSFYLRHEEARTTIAIAGRERCLRSGYSAQSQVKRVIEEVRKLVA